MRALNPLKPMSNRIVKNIIGKDVTSRNKQVCVICGRDESEGGYRIEMNPISTNDLKHGMMPDFYKQNKGKLICDACRETSGF